MNKKSIIRTVAPLAAALMLTGCVDDKYDLTDIDTTSRITVKNLTVPVNLGEIYLKNVLDLDDNENISIDEYGKYCIEKKGEISTSEFKINAIRVVPASIAPNEINVRTYGVTVDGSATLPVPASAKSTYDISLRNVDKSLLTVTNVKSAQPIEMKITLEVPSSLTGGGNLFTFQDFKIQIPWGLSNCSIEGADASYSEADGMLTINSMTVGDNGKGMITLKSDGIVLGEKGTISSDRMLAISGEVGLDGGNLIIRMNGVKLPDILTVKASYSISAFDLASFSGNIDYRMNNVEIAPISLSDLPDFLSDPETKIYLVNPHIDMIVNNPVGEYGVIGSGNLKLTSFFAGGNQTTATSDSFTVGQSGGDIHLYESSVDWEHPYGNFPGFGSILANDKQGGLPGSIKVAVENLSFAGVVKDFPIYHNGQGTISGAKGNYTFNTQLAFAQGTKIVYEQTEGDWGGDDLDDINITHINLTADCTTDLPVNLELQVFPIDRDGNLIPVDEDSSRFRVPAVCQGQKVELTVKGKNGAVINHFDGIRFRAVITGDEDNPWGLMPDLNIKLDNLRINVDGYLEKKL